MNGNGESYSGIVPAKRSNEGQGGPQETVEGRPLTKKNTEQLNSNRTPSRGNEPSGLERVRQAAKEDKGLRFTALLHHVNVDLLRSRCQSLKKQAAGGRRAIPEAVAGARGETRAGTTPGQDAPD
jgi:hypothetical protein